MSALGAPLAQSFFEEMAGGASTLGPAETIWDRNVWEDSEVGALSVSMSRGTRRSGFETVRDLLTRLRGEWANEHLESYLRHRAEEDIGNAVRLYQRSASDRGKPLTLKQFVKAAVVPANLWFGGDICGFYNSFGETCPAAPVVVAKPVDRTAFVAAAFCRFASRASDKINPEASNWMARRLSNAVIAYLQLEEALDHSPTMEEFRSSTIAWAARELKTDSQQVWGWFQEVVRLVQTEIGGGVPPAVG
jgi:hypothetical protein